MEHCVTVRTYGPQVLNWIDLLLSSLRKRAQVMDVNKSVSDVSIPITKVEPTNLAARSPFVDAGGSCSRISLPPVDRNRLSRSFRVRLAWRLIAPKARFVGIQWPLKRDVNVRLAVLASLRRIDSIRSVSPKPLLEGLGLLRTDLDKVASREGVILPGVSNALNVGTTCTVKDGVRGLVRPFRVQNKAIWMRLHPVEKRFISLIEHLYGQRWP